MVQFTPKGQGETFYVEKNWLRFGIIYVNDVICENRLINYKQVIEIYGPVPILEYNALLTCVKE